MRRGGSIFFLALAACTREAPPPPPHVAPPAPRDTGCDEAARLWGTLPELETEGRLASVVRVIAKVDAKCPAMASQGAVLKALAEAELRRPGDVLALIQEGMDAKAAGVEPAAMRAFDHAIAVSLGEATMKEGAPLAGVTALAWLREGDHAVGVGAGPDLRLIDARSGAARAVDATRELGGLQPFLLLAQGAHVAMSETGGSFVASDERGEPMYESVGGPSSGAAGPRSIPFPVAHVTEAAFAPGSDLLAYTAGRTTALWDPFKGAPAAFSSTSGPGAFALSPDGRLLAVRKPRTGFPFGVDIVDGHTRAPRGTPLMNTRCDDTAVVAWSPDSSRLAVGSTTSFVCIWEIAGPRLVHEFDLPVVRPPQGPAPPAKWLAFTPSGAGLLGGAAVDDPELATVDLYRVADAARLSSLGLRKRPIALGDGSMLLFGKGAPPVLVTRDLRVVALTLLETDGPVCPGGLKILGVRDGALRVLDLLSSTVEATLEGTGEPVAGLAFSPSGSFVSGFSAGSLRIWATATGALRASASEAQSCVVRGHDIWLAPASVCADLQSR